jgi:predicted Zn-ribbon and HTH transcriptional regulator
MSISMDQFAAEGHFAKHDPHSTVRARAVVVKIECRCCGFEPEGAVVPPTICPKCHSRAWSRFAKPGGTLENADRFVA